MKRFALIVLVALFAACTGTSSTDGIAPIDATDTTNAGIGTRCRSDVECSASALVCDRLILQCVECVADTDCNAGQRCLGSRCITPTACTSSRMCPGQVCNPDLGFCVDCITDVDCFDGTVCRHSSCVAPPRACESSRECSDLGLVCEATSGRCVECLTSMDCPPGQLCNMMNTCGSAECTAGTTRACYSGPAGTQGVGRCATGMARCTATNTWDTTCVGQVLPAATEICGNGLDDDCNGMPDDGCAGCTSGEQRLCYSGPAGTQGVGRCQPGSQQCRTGGTWNAVCAGEVVPAASETCGNGVDDDCNGAVDDGCSSGRADLYSGADAVFTCGAYADGTIRCAGRNDHGQLGDGTTTSRSTPVRVVGLAGAADVALGGSHACARMSDQSLQCWGANADGQLGDGTTTSRGAPATVPGVSTALRAALGERHSCALGTDGSVRCWGANDRGQIGDGASVDRTSPATVALPMRATGICAGGSHGCAVLADATVWCWGDNGSGQISSACAGSTCATPVRVTGLDAVAQVACGLGHTCARRADGSVRCWGANFGGQLGNGRMGSSEPAPQAVTGLPGAAVRIGTGAAHTCAVIADGSLSCWGNNPDGRIGDGSTVSRTTATVVPLPRSITRFTLGATHTCATAPDGTAFCWGQNDYGQQGDGTSMSHTMPSMVLW